jgi:hypothetical protein
VSGKLNFHVPRKSGRLVLTLVQKIWTSCSFAFPGNLGDWYLRWSRKSGPVVVSRSQEIWVIGIYVGPENLDQL